MVKERNKIIIVTVWSLLFPLLVLAQLPPPIECQTFECVILNHLRYFLGVTGLMATIMIIYSGFMMITSGGNTEKIMKSKMTLYWAVLGLVVIFFSWMIVKTTIEVMT